MTELHRGQENSTNKRRKGIGALVGVLFLLIVVLVAVGVIIANSGKDQEAPLQKIAAVDQILPTATFSTSTATQIIPSVPAGLHTLVPSISPTLIPSLTPLPTGTATAPPTTTPPPPAATQSPLEFERDETPTKSPPLPTPAGVYSWTLKVPVLMYHYISVPPENADKYRTDLSVAPNDFRRQMAYLAENGFETIDLYDLSLAITAKKDLPEKPVIITMDDGYRDNFENAFPILQEFGMKATFFVVTEFIDAGYESYLDWEMAKEMAAAGMSIEPHSKTHADLRGQDYDYVLYEVLGSQKSIAAHIGHTPRYFCYPGGRYDETTLKVVQELDFWGAVTTVGGEWHGYDNRYEWSRLRMRNTTTLSDFIDMVNPKGTVSGKKIDN